MPDSPNYRTIIGSFLSIFTLTVIVFYASYKAIDLKEMNDYTVIKATHDYFYSLDFKFS